MQKLLGVFYQNFFRKKRLLVEYNMKKPRGVIVSGKNLTVAVLLVTVLSGCAIGRAIYNWADRVGQKMPVYDEESRCSDRLTCFTTNGNQAQQSKPTDMPNYSGYDPRYAPTHTPSIPPENPAMYQDSMSPMQEMDNNQLNNNSVNSGHYPGYPADLSYQGQQYQPQQQYPYANPMVQNPGSQKRKPVNQPYDPASYNGGMVEQQKMMPWEENPEWKKDLPPSPIDGLKEGIDW